MHPSIAIDATHYENEAPTGVEGYTRELINRLVPILVKQGVVVSLIVHREPKHVPKGAQIIVSPHVRYWSARALPRLLRALAPTMYFTPSGIPPRNVPCLTSCTVHDLAVYHDHRSFSFMDRMRLTSLSKRAAQRTVQIFTPSEYTKQEVCTFWNIPKERIVVTPLAIATPGTMEKISGIDPNVPIIAYIGRIEQKKNVDMLLSAIEQISIPAQLVLAGKEGYGGEVILLRAESMRNSVHTCGYITDAQKQWLLQNARIVAIPSPLEGFGIPVLEAFQAGTPAFCSRAGSLPEVGGEAAYYLPPDSASAWAEAFTRALTGQIDLATLIEAGKKRLQQFSWEQTAEITAQHLIKHLL